MQTKQQSQKENSFQIMKYMINKTCHSRIYVLTYFGQATNHVRQVEIINYLLGKER